MRNHTSDTLDTVIQRMLDQQAGMVVPDTLDLWPGIKASLAAGNTRPQRSLDATITIRGHASRVLVPEQPTLSSFESRDGAPRRGWLREAVNVAAACIGFIVVAALLMIVFRDGSTPSAERSGGAPTRKHAPAPTVRLTGVSGDAKGTGGERLYVGSTSELLAIDSKSNHILYTIAAPLNPDVALSPDGTQLYVAGTGSNAQITAFDAIDGSERWRVSVANRMVYHFGDGPSSLAVAPDGTHVYVVTWRDDPASQDPTAVHISVQTLSSSTGTVVGETEPIALSTNDRCAPDLHAARDGQTLYLVCQGGRDIYLFDVASGQPSDLPFILPGAVIVGAVDSPAHDGIYVVANRSTGYSVSVIDTLTRVISQNVQLDQSTVLATDPGGLVTLSSDSRTLIVGVTTSQMSETGADEVVMYDTATWQAVRRFAVDPPLTGQSLAVDDAGSSIYGTAGVDGVDGHGFGNTVVRIDLATGTREVVLVRSDEVLRLLTARLMT